MDTQDYQALNADDIEHYDQETDILVVGFGIAGASAALGAIETSNDVLVLERASGISGTTTAATGHFYLGGGTPPQLANDIEDSAEEMFKYVMANTPAPEEDKIRLYCDESINHFHWLVEMGIPFNNGFYRKKHYEQPTDECLIWSGNEKLWPIINEAKPAPRGHKVEIEGGEGGSLVMKQLTQTAEQKGVTFQYDANVKHLIQDSSGAITGVCYSHFGDIKYVKANAVILAAGGFAMNEAMVEKYCARLANAGVFKQGNPFDDGAAINMGLAVGGEALHMDGCLVTSPFYPPEDMLKGILVNGEGKRFTAEDAYHARTATACLDQANGESYLICDNDIFGRPELGLQELIDAWETIEEMEADLKLPEGSLIATVENYNANAEKGEDPEFHKHSDWLKPLASPPYAALQCSLGKAAFVGFTLGGLKTSIDGEVIHQSTGQPVKGLYAAGACASNIAQDGAGYSSGTCLGEGSFFGRRAGRHAASLSG